jgi:uncharacterized membrane protein
LALILFVVTISASISACKHEPLVPLVNGSNGGGNGGDDSSGTGIPCNPNTVYFEQQVLPILIANCAKSGCHDAASAEEGVILNNYNNVMTTGEVTPFNLGDSEIWEVINETDPDKVMPPPGENPLTPAQINLIAQWINQGAQNVFCDDNLGPCDSVSVSYATDVQPIIQNKCLGCHGTANSGNSFISLANHAGVAASAATGQLVGSIVHNSNYTAMPSNGPMLNTCEIAKIKNWVSEGSLNN